MVTIARIAMDGREAVLLAGESSPPIFNHATCIAPPLWMPASPACPHGMP